MRAMFTPIFSPQWREYRDGRNPGLIWRIIRLWAFATALMVILTGVITLTLALVTVWAFQWLYALIRHHERSGFPGFRYCSCGWVSYQYADESFDHHRKPELFLMRGPGAPGRALSKWMNR